MQLIPSLRRKLELGPQAYELPRYKWKEGMAFLPDHSGGVCFPQVYCRPVFGDIDAEVRFTDDIIFKSPPNPLLRLVVLVDNMTDAEAAHSELENLDLQATSRGMLKMEEVCFLVHDPFLHSPTKSTAISGTQIHRVATGEEFAKSSLCVNRPGPEGYDMYKIKVGLQGRRYILVRPDKIVFAACGSGEDLRVACGEIPSVLLGCSSS